MAYAEDEDEDEVSSAWVESAFSLILTIPKRPALHGTNRVQVPVNGRLLAAERMQLRGTG